MIMFYAREQTLQKVVLKNQSETFDDWKRPRTVYQRFYFFDVENPWKILSNDSTVKPNVTQRGPYTYR